MLPVFAIDFSVPTFFPSSWCFVPLFIPQRGAIAKPFHLIHHVRVSCTVICHAISGEVLYCNASCKVPLLYPPVNVIHCHVYGQIKLCRVVSCNNIIHIIQWHANACNKMAYAVMQWNTLSCNVIQCHVKSYRSGNAFNPVTS